MMDRSLFALLCVSAWINYMDRGNLSVAAPVLGPELGLTTTQMGILFSSFFWTYSLLQPLAGWLVDRWDVYRIYAAGFALWSIAVAAGGFATGFWTLLAARLALGIGESIAYPAYSKIMAQGFPEQRRGFANSMIDVGTKAGPALGTLVGGLMIAVWGWRPFFILMGGVSLIWLVPWLKAIPKDQAKAKKGERGTSMLAILRLRPAWATFLGLFCSNYAYYFLLTWLPSYLVVERKFSLKAMAVVGALPYCATALASLTGGYCADRWIRAGADAGRVRQTIAVSGLLLCAATLPFAAFARTSVAMVCLIVAFAGIGLFTSCVWAITQTLAGKSAAGMWTGLQNGVGNMGGVVAPVVTAWVYQSTGSFTGSFLIASLMLVFAAGFFGLLVGRIRQVIQTTVDVGECCDA